MLSDKQDRVIVKEEVDRDKAVTHRGRAARLQAIMAEIDKRRSMKVEDIIKFGLNEWLISSRVLQVYVTEIIATGKYTVKTPEGIEYIVKVEDGGK